MSTLVIDVPAALWLTANGRYHWAERARRTRELRALAAHLARHHRLPRHGADETVRVTVYVHGRTRRRLDPANAYPTVKAVVDGLTDAGVWVDDDAAHLVGPDPRGGGACPDLRAGWHRLTIHIETEEAA